MTFRGRTISLVLAAPLLSCGLLVGMGMEQRTYITPADVEPYHARAKDAIHTVPYVIGFWAGKDDPVPVAAQKLLRPNEILSRTYIDKTTDAMGPRDRAASLLIVQCRDSRDMLGHYPPRCYPSTGMTKVFEEDRDWTVGDLVISGKEYHFTRQLQGQTHRTTVYNFFVVPTQARRGSRAVPVASSIKRDMDAVRDAAEDYQQRYYGAAQFQVVFQGLAVTELPRGERDEIFATLIEPALPAIKALASFGGDAPPAAAARARTAARQQQAQQHSNSQTQRQQSLRVTMTAGSGFESPYPSGELQ
jgi:hypothetical protein